MSIINPIQAPYPSTHTGVDRVISSINTVLANIPWIERRFNKALLLPEMRNEIEYRQPRIYSGGGEHFNVMPNDRLQSFSFMMGVGPAALVGDEITGGSNPVLWTKRIDLIIYGDLKKIDPAKDYVFTEELNENVLVELAKVRNVIITNVWYEDIRDVYEGIDLSEIERDYLYYPKFGLRYQLQATYFTNTGPGVLPPGGGLICNS